jgi:hypothetical protein
MEVPSQMMASWYVYFFQMKNVATWIVEKDDFTFLKGFIQDIKEFWPEELWEK